MPSLEEAWKGMELAWAQDHPATYNRAARILALAVLEEATRHLSFAPGQEHGQRYEDLRTQIETLGK